LKSESELDPGSANAVIKTQEFHADGFSGKRMPRSVDNVRTDSPQVPVGGRGIEARPAIRCGGFIDFFQRDGANQHAIALDESKIGGHDQLGAAEHLTHGAARFFPEQPRQDGAGLGITFTERRHIKTIAALSAALLALVSRVGAQEPSRLHGGQ